MESFDPYVPPQSTTLKPLGSLAQSARGKELSSAKRILIGVGILTLGLNGFLLYNLPNEIDKAIRLNNVPPDQVEKYTTQIANYGYLRHGGPLLLGFVFVALGIFVRKFPVPITIVGLTLYLGAALVFAVINPVSIFQGVIVKVLIVVAFLKAIKAAQAYQAETRQAQTEGLIRS